MDRGVEPKRSTKSIISSIKRISDRPDGFLKRTADGFKDDLGLDKTKRNINDYSSKIKGRSQGTRDIFSDILDTLDGVLGTEKEDSVNPGMKSAVQSKTLKYAKIAADKALLAGRQIISDTVKSNYFSGQGGCSSNTESQEVSYEMSPKEFDFTNMLRVDPLSISGKMMYENLPDTGVGVQFDRKLYEKFDNPTLESIETKNGDTLFDISWDSATQKYTISPGSSINVSDFISEYYNTIETPNLSNVLKNAMTMTIQGDGTEGVSFNIGMTNMNRLLTKLFAVCGSSNNNSPFLTNATNLLTEDEMDVQDYFNFDDVEGINLDDEDARKRRVLKFRDCNDFEIQTNSNHIEDFAYLATTKNLDENIEDTLKKVAVDAYEQSEGSIYLEGFQMSIMNSYILQIPRALVSVLLSPKMIFPITLSYKMLEIEASDTYVEVKDLMKKLAPMFFDIIKTVFWTFIREFWALAKKDVLRFVKDVAIYIFQNAIKKIKAMVLALIKLLLRALEGKIESCSDIFNTILRVIQNALNRSVSIPIPGLLLVLSEALPGFSADRAYMDALQRMEDAGINTGDIYGSENKLPAYVKSIIDAYSNEMDTNSYVKIALRPTVIPTGPGGAVISPLVGGSGKLI